MFKFLKWWIFNMKVNHALILFTILWILFCFLLGCIFNGKIAILIFIMVPITIIVGLVLLGTILELIRYFKKIRLEYKNFLEEEKDKIVDRLKGK